MWFICFRDGNKEYINLHIESCYLILYVNDVDLPGVFFGALCIGMAGVASLMGSILQVNMARTQSHFLLHSTTKCWALKQAKLSSLFLLQGSSVHIWHDQRASSRSVPIRHAIPHVKLNSEYFFFLLEHSLTQRDPAITQRQLANKTVTHPGSIWLAAVFTLQGGLVGMIIGLVLALWVGIGGQIYPPTAEKTKPLPLTTVGCNRTTDNYTTTAPWTSPVMLIQPGEWVRLRKIKSPSSTW